MKQSTSAGITVLAVSFAFAFGAIGIMPYLTSKDLTGTLIFFGLAIVLLSIAVTAQWAEGKPTTNSGYLFQEKSIAEEHKEMWMHACTAADIELKSLKEFGKLTNPQTKWLELVNKHMTEQITMYNLKNESMVGGLGE